MQKHSNMKAWFVKNIANLLTLLRLLAVIPILLLLYSSVANRFLYALIVFCLAIPTDALDGFLARKLNQTSELGRFLDPLCDKTLIYVMLFSLFKLDVYAWYIIFPMFLRDILVDGLRNYMAKTGQVIPANISGKIKFLFQTLSVIFGLLYLHLGAQTLPFYAAVPDITLACAFLLSLGGIPLLCRATPWRLRRFLNRSA